MTHKELEQKIQEYLDNTTPETLQREYDEYCAIRGIVDKPWISLSEQVPRLGEEVLTKDADGVKRYLYLCACCGKEWRESMLGHAVCAVPTHWKEVDDEA